jgi:drug/metabolite transporter (DMT)-like permease
MSKKDDSNNNSNQIGGFNVLVISVISFLYILLITKLAEIISIQYSEDDSENQISLYVMLIYFISIIGIIIGYIWFSDNNINNSTPNWIIRWSLSIGGVLMLIYTIINYWEYLNDYCKILLIFLSITSIIYYLYKYY